MAGNGGATQQEKLQIFYPFFLRVCVCVGVRVFFCRTADNNCDIVYAAWFEIIPKRQMEVTTKTKRKFNENNLQHGFQ